MANPLDPLLTTNLSHEEKARLLAALTTAVTKSAALHGVDVATTAARAGE